eukprot:3016443-Pyramimonas_sp.AAC.1
MARASEIVEDEEEGRLGGTGVGIKEYWIGWHLGPLEPMESLCGHLATLERSEVRPLVEVHSHLRHLLLFGLVLLHECVLHPAHPERLAKPLADHLCA